MALFWLLSLRALSWIASDQVAAEVPHSLRDWL